MKEKGQDPSSTYYEFRYNVSYDHMCYFQVLKASGFI